LASDSGYRYDRAKRFYEAVFGLQISLNQMGPLEMGWFPMENNLYGAAGGLVKAVAMYPPIPG